MTRGALNWSLDGMSWPNHEASQFVDVPGQRFHVQIIGKGPPLLLLHGTGASSHSWAGLVSHLCHDFTLIMPDLPGHAFSSVPAFSRLTLTGMADDLLLLLKTLGLAPAVVAGHSAGAAIAMQMGLRAPQLFSRLISFNGALFPFKGLAGTVFPPLAKLMMWNPLMPRLFAASSTPATVKRLLDDTGSQVPPQSLANYARLFSSPDHAGATLAMMANWNLAPLRAGFSRLQPHVTLVKALRDKMVPPADADQAHHLIKGSTLVSWPGLGHLAHEENPAMAANLILDTLQLATSLKAV
jgi:magnesium chelatase accessory protein